MPARQRAKHTANRTANSPHKEVNSAAGWKIPDALRKIPRFTPLCRPAAPERTSRICGMGVAAVLRHVVTFIAHSAAALLLLSTMVFATTPDPFAWLRPVVSIDADARGRLDRGDIIVRTLPAVDGELGVFAAARLNADPETFAAWMNAVAQLKKSRFVLGVRRLSEPPAFDDLENLSLDDTDLEDLRRCRPGDCDVKLSIGEIAVLRRAADAAGLQWKSALQEQFRHVIWNRIASYEANGFDGLMPYADRRRIVDPKTAFNLLLDRSPYLQSTMFGDAEVESFFYWSKEQYGTGKPVIGITHVEIVRPRAPGALRIAAVSREIFATHYRNASLGLTAVTDGAAGERYLVYINRSQLDVLGGIFSAWKRSVVEGRVKNDSAGVFNEIRRRLESGPPPE